MRILSLPIAALVVAHGVAAQTCPNGRAMKPTLGVGQLQCVTGDGCTIGDDAAAFSTEPSVWKIAPHGPAGSVLRDGDVIVAVEGNLITTRAGGAMLVNLPSNQAVHLRIRRNGIESETRITPTPSCDRPRLLVMTPPDADRGADPEAVGRLEATARRQLERLLPSSSMGNPPVDFGMALDCGLCGWREGAGRVVFETTRPILVVAVDSGGPASAARLAADDLILEVNRIPVTDARAARILGGVQPGQPVTFGVWRRGQILMLTVTPQAVTSKDMRK